MIQNITHLLRARRFVPLFATQFLGAFNDSLFKQAVVLFVTYQLYSNPAKEFQFSAIAQGLFILPFFLFSALSGQLADDHDKARLIRIIKLAEIGIMIVGIKCYSAVNRKHRAHVPYRKQFSFQSNGPKLLPFPKAPVFARQ